MKIIIYDNECMVCSRFILMVNKFDNKKELYFSHTGSDYYGKLVQNKKVDKKIDSIIFLSEDKIYYKSDAIIEIFKSLFWFGKIGNFVYVIPKKIRDFLYDLFAKNRYRYGRKDFCNINISISKRIIK
jgi:predicted DCC family thiol-disulfide oxidoreductase YuxK